MCPRQLDSDQLSCTVINGVKRGVKNRDDEANVGAISDIGLGIGRVPCPASMTFHNPVNGLLFEISSNSA